MSFVRVPTTWIRDRQLSKLKVRSGGVLELKVYFALVIAKGDYQRRMKSEEKSFPATIDEISAVAHVSRPHAVEGLRLLRVRKLIKVGRSEWRKANVGHRTTFHEFRGAPMPFFKFPWQRVAESPLLKHLRLNTRASLNALKLYLLLGAFRDNRSGVSRMSFETMNRYGVNHNAIREAVDLLIQAGLVALRRSEERAMSNQYRLTGLDLRWQRAAGNDPGAGDAPIEKQTDHEDRRSFSDDHPVPF